MSDLKRKTSLLKRALLKSNVKRR